MLTISISLQHTAKVIDNALGDENSTLMAISAVSIQGGEKVIPGIRTPRNKGDETILIFLACANGLPARARSEAHLKADGGGVGLTSDLDDSPLHALQVFFEAAIALPKEGGDTFERAYLDGSGGADKAFIGYALRVDGIGRSVGDFLGAALCASPRRSDTMEGVVMVVVVVVVVVRLGSDRDCGGDIWGGSGGGGGGVWQSGRGIRRGKMTWGLGAEHGGGKGRRY